ARAADPRRRRLSHRQARLARRLALSAVGEGRNGAGYARRTARAALIPAGRDLMRHLLITTGLAMAAASAGSAQPRPAEANVRTALERIARVDPALHSVIAV